MALTVEDLSLNKKRLAGIINMYYFALKRTRPFKFINYEYTMHFLTNLLTGRVTDVFLLW